MRRLLQTHIPPVRTLSYFRGGSRVQVFLKSYPLVCDGILIVFAVGLLIGFYSYFSRFSQPLQAHVDIDLSLFALPKYTFFSMSRGLLGYVLSLIFSLCWGFWAAKDRTAEKCLIPVLDVLQSIPILGFMPGLILLLVGLFPHTNVGLELAAIVMIFTSQAWNMAFGVYHSVRIIPQEKIDCANAYRFSNWQRFKWLEIPYVMISLIWNSIMSMAGGWFFLIVNEAFRLGDRDFRLPGLGSYMSVAAGHGDIPSMLAAVIAMIVLIVFLDGFLWKPLVMWSQKFRVEDTGSSTYSDSLFFHILAHSLLVQKMRQVLHRLKEGLPKIKYCQPKKASKALWVSRGALLVLMSVVIFFLVLIGHLIVRIPLEQWFYLGRMALLTLARVACCIAIGTVIALPIGLKIGLSEKMLKVLEPLIQITASFPATLLFPIVILLLHIAGISMEVGSILLMLMGTQWYILFNVIAGAKAMPSDLKEVALTFGFKKVEKFRHLYLPAVFPYLVTGLIAAAGGAWNASIVAEYVTFKSETITVPGIGSTINLSAQNGDIPLLVASIVVMAILVVAINYQVWLRLYHYSEKRFALNY